MVRRTIAVGVVAVGLPGHRCTCTGSADLAEADTITACQKKFLRIVSDASKCKAGERVVTWNKHGSRAGRPGRACRPSWASRARPAGERPSRTGGSPPDATGPAGPAGPAGAGGPARTCWATGPQGPPLESLNALDGLACTRQDGSAGTVDDLDRRGEPDRAHVRGGSPPLPPPPPPPPTGGLVINEIDYDQVGADSGGFVEIANRPASAIASTAWRSFS